MTELEIKVFINVGSGRRPVTVNLVKSNTRSVWVRLRDGNVIKRNKKRDIVGY